MNNMKSRLKTWGLQQQLADTSAESYRTRRSRESPWISLLDMVSPIKVFIKFVCKLPFTFYFYILIQFFNFRTKIPLRSRKTAIAQTPTPGPLTAIGRFAWRRWEWTLSLIERRNDEPFLWNANANGLNYSTKKRQSLHPTKNLRDALVITLVWLCSKRMQRKDSHILLAFGWITLISEALILASYST